MPEYICPHCQNPIYDEEALLCHFCGESLQRSSRGLIGKIRYSRPRIIFILLIILVLMSFIILFIH